jgi:amidase
MSDLLALLDVIVADDTNPRGDFWRIQTAVEIPSTSSLRPASYADLREARDAPLAGMRIGMPRKYLGADPSIPIRPSVLALAKAQADRMRALGAEVVECDLPVVDAYETTTYSFPRSVQGGLVERGYIPKGFADAEYIGLCLYSLEDFLRANADADAGPKGGPKTLAEVEPDLMFPLANGEISDEVELPEFGMGGYIELLQTHGFKTPDEIPHANEGLAGLNRARKVLLEEWMDKEGLTALAWPASCDIAPANADLDLESHKIATTNGTWVANGNLVPRHLGIPTITIPMGIAEDIAMPFGLTFAGRGWDDTQLLQIAADIENASLRQAPPRTPALEPVGMSPVLSSGTTSPLRLSVSTAFGKDSRINYTLFGSAPDTIATATVTFNGVPADSLRVAGNNFTATGSIASQELTIQHSQWRVPYGTMVVATVTGVFGELGALETVGGR